MRGPPHLDNSLAAGLECGADGGEVGGQVLLPHRLYHLAAHHLVEAARLGRDLSARLVQNSQPSPGFGGVQCSKRNRSGNTFSLCRDSVDDTPHY